MTLPWLPLGTFSYAFVAKKIGLLGEARPRRHHRPRLRLGPGVRAGRSGPVRFRHPRPGGDDELRGARARPRRRSAGIWPRSPVGIFSLKEHGITKPKDLEGQTVAFDVGSGDFQLWPAFVKATGIDDKKVNKVTMDAAALIKALIEKQVKAEGNFFGSIAPSLWAQGLEINSILYEDYGVKMFSNVVACKRAHASRRSPSCARPSSAA